MKVNRNQIGILAVSVLTSIISYKYLPETIASHWNVLGEADGYSSKLSTLIALPSLIIFMYLLLKLIPKLDPLKKNIDEFEVEFDRFITLLMTFLLVLQFQIILWNMGTQIPFNILLPIMFGVLMYEIGNLLGKSKKNWSIGIRTPWTLSSEKVWNKTHKLGEKLFKLSLPLFLISTLLPVYSFFVIIAYIIGITIFLGYYSYKESK